MSAQDPQACTGRTDGYAEPPPCTCAHPMRSHDISRRTKERTRCFNASPNPCPCKRYAPEEVSS